MFTQLTQRFFAVSSASLLLIASVSGTTVAAESSQAKDSADGERFFAVFFAHQSAENSIAMSHTFATFVRTTGGAHPRVVEAHTISWFPVSEIVAVSRPSETGENRSLAKTLAWAEERRLQIVVTGPIEIQPELYQRAAKQAERLDRGELKYKAFDRFTRNTAVNCVHAISDIVAEPALLNSGGVRGQDATLMVVRRFQSFFVGNGTTTDSAAVVEALHLDRFLQPTSSMVAGGGPAPVSR